MSRNKLDVTARYPELRPMQDALGKRTAVLDGEIVGFARAGEALQQRMGLEGGRRVAARSGVGIAYIIFDLIHLDGRSLLAGPYEERRKLLEDLQLEGSHWQTPPYSAGGGDLMLEMSR